MRAFPSWVPGVPHEWYQQLSSWANELMNELNERQMMQVQPSLVQSIQSVPTDRRRFMRYDRGTDLTLFDGDLFKTHYINATANISLTLPTASDGANAVIVNVGAGNIALKDGATTLATLTTDTYVTVLALATSSNTPQWPNAVPLWSLDGRLLTSANIVIDSTTNGLTLKSTDGHYWAFTVNTEGALVSTDNGLTPPV